MNLQKITPFMLKNQPDQTSYLLNQVIDKVNTGNIAKASSGGSATLYPTTGQNTDGAMTQKATTDALNAKANSFDVNIALQNKVDKVAGKGLSKNDFTDALKTKLENLDPSGEENVIEKIQKNGADLPISNKTVNVTVPTKTSDLTNNSNFVSDANYVHTDNNYTSSDKSDVAEIDGIVSKIPAQASSSNQLADKAFVNSSVQTATANFRGNWASWAAVPTNASLYPVDYAGSHTPTVNDYMVVQDASDYTEETLEGTWRFKYSGTWETDGKNGWNPEYQVNETPMTAAQLAALNSGITSAAVTKLSGIQAGAEVNVQTDWNQTNTSADDYLKNKPTLGSLASKNEVQTGDIANRAITGEKIEVIYNLAVSDDSPTGWVTALGNNTRAVYNIYYNLADKFSTQPARYGFLKTIVSSNNIYQEWRTHTSGELYYRMGNTSGWSGGGWKENSNIAYSNVLDKSNITLTNGSFYGSDAGGLRKIGSGIVVGSFTIQGITKAANAILELCTLPSGWYNTTANIICGTCLGPNGEALSIYTRSASGKLMIDAMNTALNNAIIRVNLSYYTQ